MPFLKPAEMHWMYICQKCLVGCIFDRKMEFAVINTSNTGIFTYTLFCPLAKTHPKMSKIHLQSVDVKMPVLDVFLALILCMTVLLAEVYTL